MLQTSYQSTRRLSYRFNSRDQHPLSPLHLLRAEPPSPDALSLSLSLYPSLSLSLTHTHTHTHSLSLSLSPPTLSLPISFSLSLSLSHPPPCLPHLSLSLSLSLSLALFHSLSLFLCPPSLSLSPPPSLSLSLPSKENECMKGYKAKQVIARYHIIICYCCLRQCLQIWALLKWWLTNLLFCQTCLNIVYIFIN